MSDTYTAEIQAIVRRAEAAAYERGKADAKRELLEFLGSKDSNVSESSVREAPQETQTEQPGPQNDEQRQRAPKGVARALAFRALRGTITPLTAADILSHASSEYEKMVKPASMRSELRNGKKEGIYINHDGRWFLSREVRERFEAEGYDLDVQPSASESNNNGGKSNAAALDQAP